MKKSTLIGVIVFGVVIVLGVIIGVISFSNKSTSLSSTESSESSDNNLKVSFDELSVIKIGDCEFSPKGTIADTKLDINLAYTTSIKKPEMGDDCNSITINPDEEWHVQLGFDSVNSIDIQAYGKNETGKSINIKDLKLENANYSVGSTDEYYFENIFENEYNITFAKNIKLGKSTVEEVEKAYGVESSYSSFDEADIIDIQSSDRKKNIKLSFVDGILVKYNFFIF